MPTIERLPITPTVYRVAGRPDEARVEAIDMPEGDCYVTIFTGPNAYERAEAYAATAFDIGA